MQDGFSVKVLDVLKDPLSLPQEFLDFLVQHQAVNGLPITPQEKSTTITYGTRSSNVSTIGGNFASGADILANNLSFTAVGGNSYLVRVSASSWSNGTSGSQNQLRINLDGADAGYLALFTVAAANQAVQLVASALITPSAGSHTLNVRLVVTGGTGTIQGNTGGAANYLPITVSVASV